MPLSPSGPVIGTSQPDQADELGQPGHASQQNEQNRGDDQMAAIKLVSRLDPNGLPESVASRLQLATTEQVHSVRCKQREGSRGQRERVDESTSGLTMTAKLRQRLSTELQARRALRSDRQAGLGRGERGACSLLPGIMARVKQVEKPELKLEKRVLGLDPDSLLRVEDRGVPPARAAGWD
jgi:hypothetical protein